MRINVEQMILSGELDDSLTSLEDLISVRRTQLAREMRPGDVVRLTEGIRPKYLIGLQARVVRRLETNLELMMVDEDREAAQRFGRGKFSCPTSLVEKV